MVSTCTVFLTSLLASQAFSYYSELDLGPNLSINDFDLGPNLAINDFDLGPNLAINELDHGPNLAINDFDLGPNLAINDFDLGPNLAINKNALWSFPSYFGQTDRSPRQNTEVGLNWRDTEIYKKVFQKPETSGKNVFTPLREFLDSLQYSRTQN
ncbi:uncharacterized protein LOC128163609 [Crassostrea angulata]|uniref:uncharacterized protein LOC128163609 n=1 Tax=Magallana angulata TaxID=2784310 RepID=UPI0022B0B4A3|nr:uncharacterized protein LOC128163609 [Crassostrea angulata]